MPFESPFDPAVLDGVMDVEIIDFEGRPPRTILRSRDNYKIHATLNLAGLAVPFLGGTFTVQAFAEDLAASYEGPITAEKAIPCDGSAALDVTLDGRVFQDDETGAYKLMVIWLYKDVAGHRNEIAAFYDGPVFQVYDRDD